MNLMFVTKIMGIMFLILLGLFIVLVTIVNFHRNILSRCLPSPTPPLLLHSYFDPDATPYLQHATERHVLILLSVVHLDVLITIVFSPTQNNEPVVGRSCNLPDCLEGHYSMACIRKSPRAQCQQQWMFYFVDKLQCDSKIKPNIFYLQVFEV